MAKGEQDAGRQPKSATVQSVDRALLVLEILATLGQAGVTEIAAELGVHKSTVSRLISVLESRGYVEQISERGKYRLGFAIARLARATSAQLDLVKLSQDVCDALAAEVGETTNLAILDGDRIVNIAEAIGPRGHHAAHLGRPELPGARHVERQGAARRARAPPRCASAWLPRLESFTDNTVTTRSALEARARRRARSAAGPASREELEVGLNAVAAPVYDADAQVVAALSVSGPSYRLGEDAVRGDRERTIAAAESISRRLGWIDRPRAATGFKLARRELSRCRANAEADVPEQFRIRQAQARAAARRGREPYPVAVPARTRSPRSAQTYPDLRGRRRHRRTSSASRAAWFSPATRASCALPRCRKATAPSCRR